MERILFLLSVLVIFMGFSCCNYVRESKTIYEENGIKFTVNIRGNEGFIYVTGPYIEFIAENNTSLDVVYLKKAVMKVGNSEKIEFKRGISYTNGEPGEYFFLPFTISNNCKWRGITYLPDPAKFAPGLIPCVLTTKFQLNGVEKEVIREFEIKVE